MVKKEAIAARLNSDEGISYTEFSYQLLQGLDYLQLYRDFGCTLQTGGNDQWGNLTAGSDLIHRVEGASVHLLTTPLLTDSSGEKFGKSAGNAIWLSAEMTSPYAFYQYWLNVEDASVVTLLKVFTDRSREEVAELEQQVAEEPFRRAAQRTLAADVTTLVHGAAATAAVRAASEALFGKGDLRALDPGTLADATAELPGGEVHVGMSVVDALVAVGLVESRNAARRAIGEGGASVNGDKVTDVERVLEPDDLLHGRVVVLRRGRKALAAGRVRHGPLTLGEALSGSRFGFRRGRHLLFSTSAREGGTDAKRMGANPAPSRPVPRAEPLPHGRRDHTGGPSDRGGAGGREGASMGHPLRSTCDHGPAALRADRGFDAEAMTRVSLNSCLTARGVRHGTSPDDVLTERAVGARPNLENSTACQKSMPINLVPSRGGPATRPAS